MRRLTVEIEINGKSVYVGDIVGNDHTDTVFTYADEYIDSVDSRAISISLPLEKRSFSVEQTKNFFEGLLPEGFMRRSVAEWLRTDENDYITILAGLGNECLGAIKISDNGMPRLEQSYIKLTDEEVRNLAREGATESVQLVTKAHLSLTGASGKVGLYFDEANDDWYLPMGEAPSTHIVKQSHIRLKKIVANEQLCLLTAKNLGIDVADSFVVNLGSSNDEDVLFATKRYDRKIADGNRNINGLMVPYRLHQEDFAQALGIPASRKYEKDEAGYMKKLFEVIGKYSANPIEDRIKIWDVCIFNYLVGNTDNHIKNFSLVYSEDLKSVRLAPAYDIISTMIYESSAEDMAMSIGGVYNINKIGRESFARQAKIVGLGNSLAMKRFDTLVQGFVRAMNAARLELEEKGFDGLEDICQRILDSGGIRNFM